MFYIIKTEKFKPLLFLLILIFGYSSAFALDFISGRDFNPQAGKGYIVQPGDTIAGYPIFAADGDWKVYFTFLGEATSRNDSAQQPIIYMWRSEQGKWAMEQVLTVTTSNPGGNGWNGSPCSGDFLIKIHVNRGRYDRCATTKIIDKKLSGATTEALEIKFTETNSSGRLYISTFNIYYDAIGLARSEINNKDSDLNKKIKDWMNTFLEGVIKASSFEKPADAFNNVPTFSNAILNGPKNAKIVPAQKIENVSNNGNKTIQDRLSQLKSLFDSKLITEEDYNKKRSEILSGL
jgi:hypothetical protein